ncbi:MAG: hypothetical protein AAF658_06085 [Myxococcota bacterium]
MTRVSTYMGLACFASSIQLASCSSDLAVANLSLIECSRDTECPDGVCDLSRQRCTLPFGAGAPRLEFPANAELLYLREVELLWSSEGEQEFVLTVARDPALTQPLDGFPQTVTERRAMFSAPDNGTYYWAVRGQSNDSPVRSFELAGFALHVSCPEGDCDEIGQSGSTRSPIQRISNAIAIAETLSIPEVRIANRRNGEPYREAIVVRSGVNVVGGFDETFAERGEPTLIRPDSAPALRADGGANVRVAGLHLSSEAARNLVLLESSESISFDECVFEGRSARTSPNNLLVVDSTDIEVENSRFVVRPVNPDFARAITLTGSDVTLSGSRIELDRGETRSLTGIQCDPGSTLSLDQSTIFSARSEAPGVSRGISANRCRVSVGKSRFEGDLSAIVLSVSTGTIESNEVYLERPSLGATEFLISTSYTSRAFLQAGFDEASPLVVRNNLVVIDDDPDACPQADADDLATDPAAVPDDPTLAISFSEQNPTALVNHNTIIVAGACELPRYGVFINQSPGLLSKVADIVSNVMVVDGPGERYAVFENWADANDPSLFAHNVMISDNERPYFDDDSTPRNAQELADNVPSALPENPEDQCDVPESARAVGNVVLQTLDWRSIFGLGAGALPRDAGAYALADVPESAPLKTGAYPGTQSCGTLECPTSCEFSGVDLLGQPRTEPSSIGAIEAD